MLLVLFCIGITVEAMTAALSAGKQKMDFFGVIVLALLTALGGGTVRDVVLDHHPLTWVNRPWFILVVIVAALITVQLSFLMKYFRVVFLVLDAVGLAVFSVLGTRVALSEGHGFIICCIAAVITGVAGGVLRDLMSDRVPFVFSRELYGTISVLIATVYVGLLALDVREDVVVIVALVIGLATRLLAIYYNKNLPVFEYLGDDQPVDPRVRRSYYYVRRGLRPVARAMGLHKAKYALLNRREQRRHHQEQTWQVSESAQEASQELAATTEDFIPTSVEGPADDSTPPQVVTPRPDRAKQARRAVSEAAYRRRAEHLARNIRAPGVRPPRGFTHEK